MSHEETGPLAVKHSKHKFSLKRVALTSLILAVLVSGVLIIRHKAETDKMIVEAILREVEKESQPYSVSFPDRCRCILISDKYGNEISRHDLPTLREVSRSGSTVKLRFESLGNVVILDNVVLPRGNGPPEIPQKEKASEYFRDKPATQTLGRPRVARLFFLWQCQLPQ